MAKSGPGYTIDDLIFYAGLFAGLIITFVATEGMDVHRVVRLIGGGLVGSALGWGALKVYHRMTIPDSSQDDDRPDRMM